MLLPCPPIKGFLISANFVGIALKFSKTAFIATAPGLFPVYFLVIQNRFPAAYPQSLPLRFHPTLRLPSPHFPRDGIMLSLFSNARLIACTTVNCKSASQMVSTSQSANPCSTQVQHRQTMEFFPRLFHAIQR